MPEVSPMLIGLIVIGTIIGVIAGWLFRGSRVGREKRAIHSSWKEQMGAQNKEHDRIIEQNKSLMEQISQYRTAKKESDARAKELGESLKEAMAGRASLEKQLRETRSNLEVTVRQRDRLKQAAGTASARDQSRDTAMREKDEKIFKLSRELESWQEKLPPLLEKYRLRDLEAQQMEIELQKLSAQLESFAGRTGPDDETRVEAVEDASLGVQLDASNEQYDDESPPIGDAHGESSEPNERALEDSPADERGTSLNAALEEETEDTGTGDTARNAASDAGIVPGDTRESSRGNGRSDEEAAGGQHGAAAEDQVDSAVEDTNLAETTEHTGAHWDSAPAREHRASRANGRFFDNGATDEERTAIEALLDEGTVDFDLGAAAPEDDVDVESTRYDAIEQSIVEVFDSDATIADVDELLDDIDESAMDAAYGAADEEDTATAATGVYGSAESSISSNGQDHDDLQQIKGVGPAIEKTLNDLGIYRFDQIAGMNEVEIDRVASELRGFRSRIYREDWIGQARMLLHEKADHSS